LLAALFAPGTDGRLGQRADVGTGAVSLLTGLAAVRSIDERRPVRLGESDILAQSTRIFG